MKKLTRCAEVTTLSLLSALMLGGTAHATESKERTASGLIHSSQAANHAIHGYKSVIPELFQKAPTVLYVSQAYGPAIHSYRHSGTETFGKWDVEYVSQAYGPAIYSYPSSHGMEGAVNVLPLKSIFD